MARTSTLLPVAGNVEGDEDDNHHESGSDGGNNQDGRVRLPLSDIPDISSNSGDESNPESLSDEPEAVVTRSPARNRLRMNANMGAGSSREEVNAALHETSAELRGRTAGSRPLGELQRKPVNPPYRNPTMRARDGQRRLPPVERRALDPYDVPDSPERPTQKPSRPLLQGFAFSSLKRGKAGRQQPQAVSNPASATALAETKRASATRLHQGGNLAGSQEKLPPMAKPGAPLEQPALRDSIACDQFLEELSSARKSDSTSVLAVAGDEVRGLDTQDARFHDYFPDYARTAIESRDVGGKTDDGDAVRDEQEEVDQQDQQASGRSKDHRAAPPADRIVPPVTPARAQRTTSRKTDDSPDVLLTRSGTHTRAQTAASGLGTRINISTAHSAQKPRERQSSARAQRSINRRQGSGNLAPGGVAEGRDDVEAKSVKVVPPADHPASDKDQPRAAQLQEGPEGNSERRKRRPSPHVVVRIRPSELFPSTRDHAIGDDVADNGATGDDESAEARKAQPKRQKGSKRKRQEANVSRKRQRSEIPRDEEDEAGTDRSDSLEPEDAIDVTRFYGQWLALQKVFNAPKDIGVRIINGERQPQEDVPNENAGVLAIVRLCKKTCRQYRRLQSHNGALEEHQDPAILLTAVEKRIDDLYATNEGKPPDFTDKDKSTEIYFHVFPSLLKVLEDMIAFYEASEDSQPQISRPHLSKVNDFISLILDLGRGALKYSRPDSRYKVVQPVRDGIIVPLRGIYLALDRTLIRLGHEAEAPLRLQRKRAERDQRHARELRDVEQARRRKALCKKWAALHFTRLTAEGNFPAPAKDYHLRPPSPEPGSDGDHQVFEGEGEYCVHVGPSPAAAAKARETRWSRAQLQALAEGLKKYEGEEVLERVFWAYCRPYGLLNEFNVVEVVTMAADLKAWMVEERTREGREVEEWVRRIPVWTREELVEGDEHAEREAGAERNDARADDGADDLYS